jgi:hypothetical protein
MRWLIVAAAFALLAALAAVFFFLPREPAEGAPADGGHTAVPRGAATGIDVVPSARGLQCVVAGGGHLRYVVTDERGHVIYNGSDPPPCPPARLGSYVYKAARRDGGFDVVTVAVGGVSLQLAADKMDVVVNDYMRTAEVRVRATLTNPQNAHAVVTGVAVAASAPGFACSEPKVDRPLVIPPGGSVTVELGAVRCDATDDYLYGLGGAPTALTVSGTAYYGNLQISEASRLLVGVSSPAPRPGSFAASDGSCRVGGIPLGERPAYYVLLSEEKPILRGPVPAVRDGHAAVPCPTSGGVFKYRVVTASGSVVEVPVAVQGISASAEGNATVVQVDAVGQVVFFDLYLRFANPNAGYTALNYTYTLKYNTNLLDCSLHAGRQTGTLTLQPGEARTVHATYRCLVLSKFREAKVAVDVVAAYTGGGVSTALYRGAVEGPSFVMTTPPPCPATLVYVNRSLFPLISASWTHAGGHNVTTLAVKVFPGWPEDYVPAALAPAEQFQRLSLLRGDFTGSAAYSVYLGNLPQFGDASPGPGPAAILPAPLRWTITTETGYAASVNASVPAVCTYPLLRLKAQPMSVLHQQVFTCGTSRIYDDFSKYCTGTGCSLPANIRTYLRGQRVTAIYLDPKTSPTSPPSLVMQVDAYGRTVNMPERDYGAAIAVYQLPSPVPAYGTTVSVWGKYVRDAEEAQNNVAYLSIGVDTDGDGQVDKEYIIYRYDVRPRWFTYVGAIVSAFFRDANRNPVYVCTVDSAGTCNTIDLRFAVVNAGPMETGNSYRWNYTLNELGTVVAVALAVVDAAGNFAGADDDVWVYWDDLTIEYSTCPPPSGWSVGGRYVWQSYNYLVVNGSVAYMPLVPNALTYAASFSGVGTYAVFDSSLGVVFGVSVSGSSFTALCGGGSTPLGSLPAARWVELRPLGGFGDVIIRDQHGAILARYGCRYTATPQYVGFRGGLLRVYNVTVLR